MGRAVVLAALVVAALIGGGAALMIRAQSDSESAELRLSARRAADGSVELGLQRRAGEEWAARILPDGRFLPADAAVDEWFDSGAFTLGGVGGDAGDAAAESAAQAGEAEGQASAEADVDGDGAEEAEQTEQAEGESAAEDGVAAGAAEESVSGDAGGGVGVDDRGGGGEVAADDAGGAEGDADETVGSAPVVSPADRIIDALGGVQLVRAAAPVRETYRVVRGDTLSGIAASFGVTLAELLELNGLTPTALLHPDQMLLIPGPMGARAAEPGGGSSYAPIEAAPGVAAEAVVYGTIRDQGSGVVHSAALTGADGGAQLVVACADGRLAVFVLASSDWLGAGGGDSAALRVYYQLDGGPLRGDRWEVEGGRISASDAGRLVGEFEGRERLSLWVDAGSERLWAEFAVAGLLATPIQANFNNCGG